jgi:ATP-dependent exoDNAse (exonuclease V) alpha subunit
MTQKEALDILKTGANVFLTGEPGAGKTHTINEYVRYLRAHGIEPAITASTGIAATHIGGMTIHSWSGIGIKDRLTRDDLRHIRDLPLYAKRIRRAKVLIIDEISMLDGKIFSMIDTVCRTVRESVDPFGGLQIVCVGDFFQLPPIARRPIAPAEDMLWAQSSEPIAPLFAFQSDTWIALDPAVCYLTEQHRQDDAEFLSVLSAIRTNTLKDTHIRHLESRKQTINKIDDTKATKLYSHNMDVDRMNDAALATISEKLLAFSMATHGAKHLVETLKKGCLSPEVLNLKVGATVMFTKNHPQGKFVNGTIGTVIQFDKETRLPIVKTTAGRSIEVEPVEWVIEEDGVTRAMIRQLPLRLAWAITIHKSQGMSLDSAVMDLSRVFEYGQGYVALSRVRNLAGLTLLGYNQRAFEVHPTVFDQDRFFRARSEKERFTLSRMTPKDLENMQQSFIRHCGGKKLKSGERKNKGNISKIDKLRESFPNAYRPWKIEEDTKLRKMFHDGTPARELMTSFGRQPGSIRARLEKLGLIEAEAGDRKEEE